jgi:polygalacturonase
MATDGSNQAKVLQKALDSCSAIGGCTVEVPAGTYIISPIYLRTNVNLQLDTLAVLKGTDSMNLYTINNKLADLIGGTALSNVSITGKGVIDGNGAPWWAAYFSSGGTLSRPRLIYLTACTNVTLDGITLQNSPSFHVVPNQCTTVTAKQMAYASNRI